MQGRTRWERSACSVMGAVLYISFLLFQLGQAIPFDPERDNDVNGFFVAPSEPSGREQVSMITNSGHKVRCTFEYDHEEKKEAQVKKKSATHIAPQDLLSEEMKPGKACLSAISGFHSYEACLGTEVVQYVSKDVNQKILIGNKPTWDANYFELSYTNGTPCADQKNIQRRATIYFLCKDGGVAEISNVLEPKPCVYEIEVQTPKVCDYPKQIRRTITSSIGPAEIVENWFMEIMEIHGHGITCSVQASGFGQPSPTSSRLLDKFKLRLEKDNKALPIKTFDVRHGTGVSYGVSQFEISSDRGTLRTIGALPDKFNIITVTAASP